MKIERCHICFIGFLDIGELTSEIRLINHLNMLHNTKCRECGTNFISEIHLRYHLKYTHDIECMHCNTYGGGTCSEKYGRAMSMDKQNQIAKIEIIKETEAELGEVVKKKIGAKHLNALEHIASNIDIGNGDFEIEKLCRWIYVPTPINPQRMLDQEISTWVNLDTYEAAIDAQIDAKEIEIETCAYRECGYLFVDIQYHYWQYHPQFIKPNTNRAGMTNEIITEEDSSKHRQLVKYPTSRKIESQ